jgi:hypothetical protein
MKEIELFGREVLPQIKEFASVSRLEKEHR